MNDVRLNACLVARSALRYTPSGVAVVELELRHAGSVLEAGLQRVLDFAVPALAMGDVARRLLVEALGTELQCSGFLAPRSAKSVKLVIHLADYAVVPAPSSGGRCALECEAD